MLKTNLPKGEESAIITKYGKGFLMEFPKSKNRHPILHIQGSPYEMGYSNGYLLADFITEMISRQATWYLGAIGGWDFTSGKPPKMQEVYNGKKKVMANINQNLIPAILEKVPEFWEEMKGLCAGLQDKGAPITWEDVVIINSVPEAFEAFPSGGCSNFAAWNHSTVKGKLIHGVNIDDPTINDSQESTFFVIAKPQKGNSFFGLMRAGWISPQSWMNDKMMSYGEMTTYSINVKWPQIPHNMHGRMICQYASNLKEAYNILEKTGGTTGWINLITDAKVPKAIAIEVSGTEITKRVEDPNFPNVIWVTNHYQCYPSWQGYEGINIIKGEVAYWEKHEFPLGKTPDETITWSDVDTVQKWREKVYCPRYERYRELLQRYYGKINVKKAIKIQSDPIMTTNRTTKQIQVTPPCEHVYERVRPILYRERLSSTYAAIYVPSEGNAWVAAGEIPAQKGPWWRINLFEHLELLKNYDSL